jgi:ribonuclease HI
MAGAGRFEHVLDALSAEMYACLEALKACSDQGILKVIIGSDCSALVSAMKKYGYDYSLAGVLIEEAKSFTMLNFVNVEFYLTLYHTMHMHMSWLVLVSLGPKSAKFVV